MALCACSGDETNDEDRPKNIFADAAQPDALVKPDSGTNQNEQDGAVTDCSNNPNSCAQFEVLTAFPDCLCTGVCEAGYIYNGATNMCDPFNAADGGVDGGGNGGNDGGGNGGPDGGETADAGGGNGVCSQNSDCPGGPPGTSGLCIDVMTGELCSGGNCQCFLSCDWSVPTSQSGCPTGAGCSYIGVAAAEGLCLVDSGGGTQAQACLATLDANGNITGDDCNGTQSYFCVGVDRTTGMGTCSRLCRSTNDQVCSTLGNYICEAVPSTVDLGFCVGPVPNFTDLGLTCPPAVCQSGLCSGDLGGICSASCGGLNQCPTGSACVTAVNDGSICAVECTPGGPGNTACQAINGDLVCVDLGMGFGICARP